MTKKSPMTVWYQQGLSFSCTGCGKCCTGGPGAVWVTEEEISSIADFLGISIESMKKKYTRTIGTRTALLEKPPKNGDYDCIFLEGKKCHIYTHRPSQCKSFPWWKENLASEEAWQEAGAYCEGINHQDAPLISFAEIQSQLE